MPTTRYSGHSCKSRMFSERFLSIPNLTSFAQISGDANEEQILTSAVVYRDRPVLLTKVLNDLYHLLRFETCKSIHRAFDVVLSAMDRHLRVKHMQISGRYVDRLPHSGFWHSNTVHFISVRHCITSLKDGLGINMEHLSRIISFERYWMECRLICPTR